MKYRKLGRTGLMISEVGLGGHEYRFRAFLSKDQNKQMSPIRTTIVKTALDLGVNYFDTTFIEEARSLGVVLKNIGYNRKSIFISGMSINLLQQLEQKSPSKWDSFIRAEVEDRLRLLNTDYFDVFHICALESGFSQNRMKKAIGVFKILQKEGKIHFIGASAHDSDLLERIIIEYNPFDAVMLSVNFNNRPSKSFLKAVQKNDVGFVGIKPFSWFDYGVCFIPICKEIIEKHNLKGATVAQMALRWILQYKEVSSIVPAANSIKEVMENSVVSNLSMVDVDLELLEACRNVPNRMEKMIDLIDHSFDEVKYYSRLAVKNKIGNDFGSNKSMYLKVWKEKGFKNN
jgi:aryl-alcohol dehydrogenase-like predicted oxidoreductase